MPDGYILRWKLLDAVSTSNLESVARCLTAWPIETGTLPSGDMTVWHPINAKVRAIVEGACRGRGNWNPKYNNWIVEAQFADKVLSEIATHTKKIA